MHQMHMNLANGVIPPNMQQVAGNPMFVNGTAGMRGPLGPEQMNQLLLVSVVPFLRSDRRLIRMNSNKLLGKSVRRCSKINSSSSSSSSNSNNCKSRPFNNPHQTTT
jgi:hypothetical protein